MDNQFKILINNYLNIFLNNELNETRYLITKKKGRVHAHPFKKLLLLEGSNLNTRNYFAKNMISSKIQNLIY